MDEKAGKPEKIERPKEEEPKLEDLSTKELAELKRETQEWAIHPARSVIEKESPEEFAEVQRRVLPPHQGEGSTSAPSFTTPTLRPLIQWMSKNLRDLMAKSLKKLIEYKIEWRWPSTAVLRKCSISGPKRLAHSTEEDQSGQATKTESHTSKDAPQHAS